MFQAQCMRIFALIMAVATLASGSNMEALAQNAAQRAPKQQPPQQTPPVQGQSEQDRDKIIIIQLAQLYFQGKHAEAVKIGERALPLFEQKYGKEHPDTLAVAQSLATIYQSQNRFADAEPLLKRIFEGKERTAGKDDPGTTTAATNLARVYKALGRYGEAEALFVRVKEAFEKLLGPEKALTFTPTQELAEVYSAQGRFAEAEPLLKHVFEVRERMMGKDNLGTMTAASDLARVYKVLGRYGEAEALFIRVKETFEKMFGPDKAQTLTATQELADVYSAQGRFAEAEPVLKRVFEVRERMMGKDNLGTMTAASDLARVYKVLGRYGEAEALFIRVKETFEKMFGPDKAQTLTATQELADVYSAQGRLAEAEPMLERVLQAQERLTGKDNPSTVVTALGLAFVYYRQGRYGDAEAITQRVVESAERKLGKDHPYTLSGLSGLAQIYQSRGLYRKAEPLMKRVVESDERVVGKDHPQTIAAVGNLATLYQSQGRLRDAEELHRRASEASERVLGKEHPDTLQRVAALAVVYCDMGRYGEAEAIQKRVLTTSERQFGRDHPDTILRVNGLAAAYFVQGRFAEVEPLLRRALEGQERRFGKDHFNTVTIVANLADVYRIQGRLVEAEQLYERAIQGAERSLGKDHPDTLLFANNLASLYMLDRRPVEAEALAKRVLAGFERLLGKDHPNTLKSVNLLGQLYLTQHRLDEAEPLLKRALDSWERLLGSEHSETTWAMGELGYVNFARGDWLRAVDFWRRSAAVYIRRTQRDAIGADQGLSGRRQSEAERQDLVFRRLIQAAHSLDASQRASGSDLAREMFQTAQWTINAQAARSLAQMAVRGAANTPALADLTRERQDLAAEWRNRDGRRSGAFSLPPEKRNTEDEAANQTRIEEIEGKIASIDKRLAAEFPSHAALAASTPLKVEDVQALLNDDEALALFLDTGEHWPAPEGTFIWIVTKTGLSWTRSELGTPALSREVDALRCGLDAADWIDPASWPQATPAAALQKQAQAARRKRCQELTGVEDASDGALPFDLARSHRLYQALFGQVGPLVKGKRLLVVPSGPLTKLPFHTLVTEPPQPQGASDYSRAAWLARRNAVTVLPAVASLQALRKDAKASQATKPLIGFGNPVLADSPKASVSPLCPKTLQANAPVPRSPRKRPAHATDADAEAMAAIVRGQPSLPETADELCAVARSLGVPESELRLGPRMTEGEIWKLNASGQLAGYRILHFATHGVMAGQLRDGAEPGLIMTPPGSETGTDEDGYLTASEIAGLKLDANWVILSACNTAASGAGDAEALSGLGRAFFYARARSLLVSHWAVYSDSTVKLVTGAVKELADNPGVGRAEALRRSMLKMIDGAAPQEAHPAYWAPFVLVGEGGMGY